MMHLSEILDRGALAYMMAEKRIQKQVHPTLPLVIYNYTNRAQFTGEWTHEERVCRGLITTVDGELLARGPSKFFNYGQPGAPEVAMDTKVWVTRKEDGSLGIGWEYDGHYGVATRGSFASDQAVHATDMLTTEDRARILLEKKKGRTQIWEIVYPDNHIVLHYGNRDELLKLGAVRNEDGLIILRPMGLFKRSDMVTGDPTMTFAEAVALPIPDDEEGYVIDVHSADHDTLGHIKLKGTRYKELHAATFQLSERKMWEAMGRGEDMEKFVSDLPDEIMPWAQGVVDRLRFDADILECKVALALAHSVEHFGKPLSEVPRADVARHFVQNYKEISGPMFSGLDDRWDAVLEWAHKQVRPEHRLFRVENEDAN